MAEESDPSSWRRALPAQIAAHRASGEILVMDVDVEDRRVADDLLRQRALHVRAAAAVAGSRRGQGGGNRPRIGRRAVEVGRGCRLEATNSGRGPAPGREGGE